MNIDQQLAYLAAFIDGEGHIGAHKLKSGYWTRTISFTNTDKQLFDAVIAIAKTVGLPFRISKREGPKYGSEKGWSPQWVGNLPGGKEAYEKFRQIVPIQAARKREALRFLISTYPSEFTVSRIQKLIRKQPDRSRPRINLVCQGCDNPYQVIPSRAARSKFCCAECRDKAQGPRISQFAERGAKARWS